MLKDYEVKKSVTDLKTFFANVWNYVSFFFTLHVGGEDSRDESNENSNKLYDMSYHINQIESQI